MLGGTRGEGEVQEANWRGKLKLVRCYKVYLKNTALETEDLAIDHRIDPPDLLAARICSLLCSCERDQTTHNKGTGLDITFCSLL